MATPNVNQNITPLVLCNETASLEYKENTLYTNQRSKKLGSLNNSAGQYSGIGTVYLADTVKQYLQRAAITRTYKCHLATGASRPAAPMAGLGGGWCCTKQIIDREYGQPLSDIYTEIWEYLSEWTVYRQEVIKADLEKATQNAVKEAQKWADAAWRAGNGMPDPGVWLR